MLSSSYLLAANNLFTSILSTFKEVGAFAGSLESGLQIMLFVAIGLLLVSVCICGFFIGRTYESRLLKAVIGFNRYFKKNPYINEDNLVEVNNKFKQVPKTLRYSWQEYMLNRDRQPSEYINSVTCIDQPTRSSAYKNISNTVLFLTVMISVLTYIVNLVFLFGTGVNFDTKADNGIIGSIYGDVSVLVVPMIVLFLGLSVVVVLKLLESSRYADLYFEFHEFERYLNKACSTMPSFVDYEVLFTPKEIREAIPVLQEYLEKRALQEQKEAEEAELHANHFENFNFEPVGVESALLLDRAMLEGEKYFNYKRGLTERINSKETEMFNFQKKFDEVTKEYERKSQAVRENMASLTEQLQATSVKIEANYLKKRYNEEQQKQQQLEKDYEYAPINFAKQQAEMEQEVAQLSAEIKAKKSQVEENMMSECRNYSNKVWGEINRTLQAQQEPILKEKEEKARILQEEIDKMTLLVADQDADIKAKHEYILKLEQDIKVRLAEIEAINNVREYFNTTEFRQRVSDKKKRRKVEDDYYEEEIVEEKQNPIAKIVTTENREEDIKVEETQLLDKLREVNKANSEYNVEIEEIKKRQKAEDDKVNNPFAAFSNIQKDIERENAEYLNNQQELAKSIDNTIKAVEENKVAETPVEQEEKDAIKDIFTAPVEEKVEVKDEPVKEEVKEVVEEKEEEKVEEKKGNSPKRPSLENLLNSAKKLKK